ncbi:barstar (barnase inhibitor) [Hydrogenoanaerobacterium saccharovorans]|uniref:Barstar (Barnase inhibitor) n=1 Tax=Hydrogenoanaerobacterium saccharovorans TaxID=474960 RepID=A0A1H8CRX3_9FIRM|nr:barstar family protein [Hydrogenoanaerobacterium saccharovorans]RPF43275.1 barstar (barnase inhibitor) [Hydrogenoanaerobacterium saccharovorans]SEM97622.1 Barstar (barnase inhibitor) [Hydrogenoanaerobacterium saccharovorans]
MSQKVITLDLTDCKYIMDFHQRIKKAFDFPDFYGENWSAFWDLLWSECDADKVVILGEHTMPKEFDWDLGKMHEILQRTVEDRKKHGFHFEFEIIS